MSIQYIAYRDIDKKKWDACIDNAANGLIYAYSFYLDAMAKNWDALVLNDYEAVMPLTWNKKWGIRYLYQPPFTQQLGVFCSLPTEELLTSFMLAIKKHFRFAEIFLNFKNIHKELSPRNNFILSLNEPHTTICKRYSGDAIKNIRRSEKFHLRYTETNDLHEALELYKATYASRTTHVKEDDYNNFEKLCKYVLENNMLILRKVINSSDVLQSLALVLRKGNRLYLLQSTTLPEGRKTEANYFMLDNLIKEFSEQPLLFDFEGSDIPGIAHFYKNFGAVNQPYYYYRYNNLPWLLKLIK